MSDFYPSFFSVAPVDLFAGLERARAAALLLWPVLCVAAALAALALVKSFAGFVLGLALLLRDATLLVFRYPGATAVLVLAAGVRWVL